ncbi:MAG: HesA/MoeB/ThiF family protein [Candidatus Hodarchaeales archaeon]|jgi:molybdopterin/thiamine biosynthesis adenylyltransferase
MNNVIKMNFLMYPEFKFELDKLVIQEDPFPIYGRIFDDFTVFHLIGLTPTSKDVIQIGYLSTEATNSKFSLNYPFINLILDSESLKISKVELHKSKEDVEVILEVDIEPIDLNRLFVRIDQEETPLKILSLKKVAILGMGSGGSLLALYLAKSGIRDLIFIDDDRLEVHNIIRHISDLTQLGRYKTKAVKDYIHNRIPSVKIQTLEQKFIIHTKADADHFLELFSDIDLLIAVSGEHDVNFSVNDFVHTNNLKFPIIYAGTFEGVKGGLMFKVDPRKDDLCYHCVYADSLAYPLTDGATGGSIPTTNELEKKIVYDRSMQEQLAQPGLGLDIDNLTILLAKYSLATLLDGHEHGLYQFPFNFYLWYNRTIFKPSTDVIKFEGLELCYYEDLEKNKECPFHGGQVKATLDEDNDDTSPRRHI